MLYAEPSPARRPRPACPACAVAGLRRVRRTAAERSAGQGQRRYRCAGCGWSGLLPAGAAAARPGPWLRRALPSLLGLALIGGLVAATAALWRQAQQPARPAAQRLPPGAHDEGRPLPPQHPLQRAAQSLASAKGQPPALAYRQHCVWGQPGRSPYQGTAEQALRAAQLPAEVVQRVALRIAAAQPAERLQIGNDGIRGLRSGRVFDAQRVALSYGRTLCLESRVNFPAGHTEPASLYEAADAQGRVYAVMVPDVCGNVSVLSESGERRPPELLATADASVPVAPLRRLPLALAGGGDDEGGVVPVADEAPRAVPEPGTLWAVLGGWVALALASARIKARRAAADRRRAGRR